MHAIDPEFVEERRDCSGEVRRVIGRAQGLVGLPEAGQVDRDHPPLVAEGGDGGKEGGLGRAEAVEADDGASPAGRQDGELPHRGRDGAEL